MSALAALFLRDMRMAMRVGGGALMGVLFFLSSSRWFRSPSGPTSRCSSASARRSCGSAHCLRACWRSTGCSPTDHEDGSLDLILMGRAPLELAIARQGAGALAHHRAAAGRRRADCSGSSSTSTCPPMGAVALTLLVGTPALTFIGLIGAALAVALRRGGLLVPVLILPLTIPVLIFGVAASNAAIAGPVPFGTPFTILCALSLAGLVIGPVAAAAA